MVGAAWLGIMADVVNVAVIGASGYSGEELLRLLLQHPGVNLVAVTSRRHAGKALIDVYPRFRGHEAGDAVTFSESSVEAVVEAEAEFVFLALPHGVAADYAGSLIEKGLRVIDLSADFRLNESGVYEEYYGSAHPLPGLLGEAVYGLPERYRERIQDARLVASPGCYPTSILIPLIPLIESELVDHQTIVASSMSGVSGAGRSAVEALLFGECNESLRPYGVPKHRHLSEIEQELSLAAGERVVISFVPHLVPVTAGICSTITATLADGADEKAIGRALETAYGEADFVRLLGAEGLPDTSSVIGTNYIDLGWVIDSRTGRVVLMSAEDNLGKGAASQALQSFNLMSGFDEGVGLKKF